MLNYGHNFAQRRWGDHPKLKATGSPVADKATCRPPRRARPIVNQLAPIDPPFPYEYTRHTARHWYWRHEHRYLWLHHAHTETQRHTHTHTHTLTRAVWGWHTHTRTHTHTHTHAHDRTPDCTYKQVLDVQGKRKNNTFNFRDKNLFGTRTVLALPSITWFPNGTLSYPYLFYLGQHRSSPM